MDKAEKEKNEQFSEFPDFLEGGYSGKVINLLDGFLPDTVIEELKKKYEDIPVTMESEAIDIPSMEVDSSSLTEEEEEMFYALRLGSILLGEYLITHISFSILNNTSQDISEMAQQRNELLLLYNHFDEEVLHILEVSLIGGDFDIANKYLKNNYNTNLYEIILNYGLAQSKIEKLSNESDEDIEDSEEGIIYGKFIADPPIIYINPIVMDLDEIDRNEILLHEFLHYVSTDEQNDSKRSGFTFDTLKGFEKLKEIY